MFFPSLRSIKHSDCYSISGQCKESRVNILFCSEQYLDNSSGDLQLFKGIKLNCLEESVKHLVLISWRMAVVNHCFF